MTKKMGREKNWKNWLLFFFFLRGRCTLRRPRETIATLLASYGRIRFLSYEFEERMMGLFGRAMVGIMGTIMSMRAFARAFACVGGR